MAVAAQPVIARSLPTSARGSFNHETLELDQQFHIRNGFLTRNEKSSDYAPARTRALDVRRRRRTRDEVEEDDPEVVEIHNHIPMSQESMSQEPEGYYDRAYAKDDEDPDEEGREGEVVARFPADRYHFATEGDEVVVYRGAGTPKHKSDIYDFGRARDTRFHPPQTLRQLNALHAAHYRGGRR